MKSIRQEHKEEQMEAAAEECVRALQEANERYIRNRMRLERWSWFGYGVVTASGTICFGLVVAKLWGTL